MSGRVVVSNCGVQSEPQNCDQAVSVSRRFFSERGPGHGTCSHSFPASCSTSRRAQHGAPTAISSPLERPVQRQTTSCCPSACRCWTVNRPQPTKTRTLRQGLVVPAPLLETARAERDCTTRLQHGCSRRQLACFAVIPRMPAQRKQMCSAAVELSRLAAQLAPPAPPADSCSTCSRMLLSFPRPATVARCGPAGLPAQRT